MIIKTFHFVTSSSIGGAIFDIFVERTVSELTKLLFSLTWMNLQQVQKKEITSVDLYKLMSNT